ncbi:MAG: nitrate reductase molybdenum cofactor assembly chaperone [Gammaproteobacteria bacterium]
MVIYNIFSRLLDYPDQELKDNLGLIMESVMQDTALEERERLRVQDVVAWMQGTDLLALQEVYVKTFDLTPEHSLHLTHHLFGDDRGRGPALVDLAEHYKGAGLQAVEGELPDYLPLILEYVSTLDETQARVFLNDAAKVLDVLAANLEKAQSPYAALVRVIANHGRLARFAA